MVFSLQELEESDKKKERGERREKRYSETPTAKLLTCSTAGVFNYACRMQRQEWQGENVRKERDRWTYWCSGGRPVSNYTGMITPWWDFVFIPLLSRPLYPPVILYFSPVGCRCSDVDRELDDEKLTALLPPLFLYLNLVVHWPDESMRTQTP